MGHGHEQVHVIVRGRVQGVNFRHFTWLRAQALEIRGWVRNRSDGTVEVVAVGVSHQIDALLELLQHGPSSARVDALDVARGPAIDDFDSFEIRM